ncbi:hypothetical protein [Symbioplanes lichenis]|uniref:hypothetical protein n=1 Tax=Symbioplanes lichenis TaxID=1629072 RepID=UPI00273A46D4|nr:hypothetical protein [Actinoplanes lichenis]
MRPIRTPQRQLVQLALHYSVNLPHRTLSVTGADWSAADGIDPTLSPRPLVFVDLPAGRPVIPVAVELPAGKVVLLYERLAELTSQRVRHLPPTYPSDSNPADTRKYWEWYAQNYSARTAMKVLEDGITCRCAGRAPTTPESTRGPRSGAATSTACVSWAR